MGYLGLLTALLLLGYSSAQTQTYRVCTDASKTNNCQGVELGGSRVSCVIADTSIDCALRLAAGEAEFAVFSEEEVFLLAQQQPDSHTVVGALRHQEKINDGFAFESVVVVRSTHTGGLQGLSRTGFCHPGYNYKEHRWSPRVLKYFEDTVAQTNRNCDSEARTPAGSQAAALTRFFSSACRPGSWTEDPVDDAFLKSKYSTLCDLCNNRNCSDGYGSAINVGTSNSHTQAINCVVAGSGNVTYVAWQHVRTYFQGRPDIGDYALLCPDGSFSILNANLLLNSTAPCSWVRQHWPAVVASRGVSSSLLTDMRAWMPTGRATDSSWIGSLDAIIFNGDPSTRLVFIDALPSPTDYVTPGRGSLTALETTAQSGCQRVQRWCTVSVAETLKCNWIRRAAISLGVEPVVDCVQYENEIACLNNIQMDRADFISLDSNYGYLARNRYKLSTVLYHQTQRAHNSRVVALLKASSTIGADPNSTITRFENLRGKTACFPEYGGIAWVSFVRAAHERQVISEAECNYATAVSEFFGAACAPGAELASHTERAAPVTLCGACRANPAFPGQSTTTTTTTPAPGNGGAIAPITPIDLTCGADYSNLYFSTNGTVACIAAAHTDVAFIETQYLANIFTAQNLIRDNFRVLCRNNSLALNNGIDVDENCLLSYIVDGELLARRDWESAIALKSLFFTLDDLFGYSTGVNQLVNLKIYSPFNRVSNLLFRDSVIGLTDSNSTSEQARNYEDLFRHLDACSAAPSTTPLPPPASAARVLMPLITLAITPLLARFML